jgi:drug/metabolite transporter (DMT)-like permease
MAARSPVPSSSRPQSWQILVAFAIIYFVWGSTYLCIRIGVREIPPFLMAAFRFLAAGLLLYGWLRFRGVTTPTRRQWIASSLLGFVMFVMDYGGLFWAEQRVPSGVSAVILATIPAFMALFEIAFLRTERLTIRLAFALVLGIAGVAALVNPSPSLGGAPIDGLGAAVLLISAISWSIASIFTRKLALPESQSMSAAAQMLTGGLFLLILAAATGELGPFHFQTVSLNAWLALAYLIIPGSIVGFTAYLWLLHYESPTKVGTYAYVNPVVAVILGYFLGGEPLGLRTILATALIIVSVLVITTARKKKGAQVHTSVPGSRLPAPGPARRRRA